MSMTLSERIEQAESIDEVIRLSTIWFERKLLKKYYNGDNGKYLTATSVAKKQCKYQYIEYPNKTYELKTVSVTCDKCHATIYANTIEEAFKIHKCLTPKIKTKKSNTKTKQSYIIKDGKKINVIPICYWRLRKIHNLIALKRCAKCITSTTKCRWYTPTTKLERQIYKNNQSQQPKLKGT